jgi:hypothetical protein
VPEHSFQAVGPSAPRARTSWANVWTVSGRVTLAYCGPQRPQPAVGVGVSEGLVDVEWWRSRQDDYLRAATSVFVAESPLNLIDHLEFAERSTHRIDLDAHTGEILGSWFRRIDGWLDCADFDVLRLLTLWFGYRRRLPAAVADAIGDRLLGFRYWYTDPRPVGVTDERWYWSENHRLIFHTCEYLAGQAFPQRRFGATGWTGDRHCERASEALAAWFAEKAATGFSEWHSDAYYGKDLAPLVALAEFAEDPVVAGRAAAFADLVLVDLAMHSLRDNAGSTHGRSYMRFKAAATAQPVFGILKMCFERSDRAWPLDPADPGELLPLHEGASLLARCRTYRPPEVVRRIARHDGTMVDKEGMGILIDPSGPPVDRAAGSPAATGNTPSYDDPASVPFWWDRGALTPWQLIPLTVATLDRHDLWGARLFSQFRQVRDAFGSDPALLAQLAADLHQMVNAGLLSRVDTYTWRNAHCMLSTAQSYRPGCAGYQHHISQATLDEDAIVFTNHPGHGPTANPGDYLDEDRYWTGSATLPRAVQHGRAVIQAYAPAFISPDLDVLSGFSYADFTHAYFPVERFDEVRQERNWTVGRRGGGLVGVWSWRQPVWAEHDPAQIFTNGLSAPFDLCAPGGADNVWVIEVGDLDGWGDLDSFTAALTSSSPEVENLGWSDSGHAGFRVRYHSPSEGVLEVGPDGPLQVDGQQVPIHGYPRFDNPFVVASADGSRIVLTHGGDSFVLDLAAGTRGPVAG